jgi:plasmid stabilization system protein ParE
LVEIIKAIAQNPAIFQVRYREVRIAFLNKFPFGVHFKIDANRETIVILAVLHTSQNPQIWLDRG